MHVDAIEAIHLLQGDISSKIFQKFEALMIIIESQIVDHVKDFTIPSCERSVLTHFRV